MAINAEYERLGAWAVMLEPDMRLDRRRAVRTVPMEVLSLGFPRTGTLSMVEALDMLGFASPYHFSRLFANVQDADLWQEAFLQREIARRTGVDNFDWRRHFDRLLGHSSAISDVPAICFWRELVRAYPDAKVVLVERDVEKWLPSFAKLVEGALNPAGRYALRYTDPFCYGRIFNTALLWVQDLFGTTDVATAKANAREAYLRHYAEVRATVPQGKLLEYRLGSGWLPLCEFLEKKVPSENFPHRNEAQTLDLALNAWIGKTLKASLFNISAVVGAIALLWASVRRYM